MNKFLKHFVFSNLESSILEEVRKKHGKADHYGNFKSMGFVVTKQKSEMKVHFDKINEKKEIPEKGRNDMFKVIGINIEKELETCSSVFVTVNNENKTITIQFNRLNKTVDTVNI